MNHVGVHQRAGIGGGAKKKKKSRKLGEDEMRLLLKENKKRIGGMTKQLYDLEHQAHSNRKEVEGVRASVQHILKQHDRVIKELDSDGGNRKMIGIKINEQVMEVSNILKEHEHILGGIHNTLKEFSEGLKEDETQIEDDDTKEAGELLANADAEAFADFNYGMRQSTLKISDLFEAMRDKIRSTKSLISKSEEVAAMLSLAENEILRLTDLMETMKRDMTARFQDQLDVAKGRAKEWEDNFRSLQKSINAEQEANSAKQRVLQKQIKSLEEEKGNLGAGLASANREIERLSSIEASLKREIEELKESQDDSSSALKLLENKCRKLEEKLSKQQMEMIKKQEKYEAKLKELEEKGNALADAKIADLEAKVKLLEITNKQKTKNVKELTDKVKELEDAMKDTEKSHEEQLQELLEDAGGVAREQEELQDAHEAAIDALKEKHVKELEEQREDLENEKNAEVGKLQEQVEKEVHARQNLEEELEALKNSAPEPEPFHQNDSSGEVADLKNALANKGTALDELKIEYKKLETKMETLKSDYAVLEKQCDILEQASQGGNEQAPPSRTKLRVTSVEIQTDPVSDDDEDSTDEEGGQEESDDDELADEGFLNAFVEQEKDHDKTKSGEFNEKSRQMATLLAFIRDNNLRMLDVFSALDENNDGVVTKDDWVFGMCRLVEGSHDNELLFSQEILEAFFDKADKDGNSSLNYKEFLSNLKSEFKKREVRHYAKGMNMTAKKKKRKKKGGSTSLMDRADMTGKLGGKDPLEYIAQLEKQLDEVKQIKNQAEKDKNLVKQLSAASDTLTDKCKTLSGENEELKELVQSLENQLVELKNFLQTKEAEVQEVRAEAEQELIEAKSAAVNASNMSLDGQLVKMVYRALDRVDNLATLGFHGAHFRGNNQSIGRSNGAGEFRVRLSDLQSKCKLVMKILHNRYPSLAVLRGGGAGRGLSFGSANLPSLVTGPIHDEPIELFRDSIDLYSGKLQRARLSRPYSVPSLMQDQSRSYVKKLSSAYNDNESQNAQPQYHNGMPISVKKNGKDHARFLMSPLNANKKRGGVPDFGRKPGSGFVSDNRPATTMNLRRSLGGAVGQKRKPLLFVGFHP